MWAPQQSMRALEVISRGVRAPRPQHCQNFSEV